MSHFTDSELKYIQEQQIGRMATVSSKGMPHIVPVSYRYNSQYDSIDIYGIKMKGSLKYEQIVKNNQVAFVIDDISQPMQGRGVELRGHAQLVPVTDEELPPFPNIAHELIRIVPTKILSWGLTGDRTIRSSRNVQQNS